MRLRDGEIRSNFSLFLNQNRIERFIPSGLELPIRGVTKPVNSQEARIDEVRIRQQELPNKGI